MKRTCVRSLGLLLAAAALITLGSTQPARAAGLLVADGGLGGVLQIKEHDVHVTLNNGIAVTKVTQVFHNTERRPVEALFTFPVPKGASVANFSMWIHGKEMVGEVVEKQRAREIYNSYKQSRRDPGLLEQTDFRTFDMRIFPIGPEADQKVELTYYQELDFDHDWASYVYPLATATRQAREMMFQLVERQSNMIAYNTIFRVLGWMFVLAAEFLGASQGLGFLLIDGQQLGKPAQIVAAIVAFAVLGKFTDWLVALVAAPFLRWEDVVVRG